MVPRMRSPQSFLASALLLGLSIFLPGCASVQAPLPPSLELPKPPNDLRSLRKGNRVYLFWSVPTQTVDRQTVRRPGPTHICRSLEPLMSSCGTPVGNVPPASASEWKAAPGNPYPQASFVDVLPLDLQQQNANRVITYGVDALNRNARGAGLSNQVHVPLAPTLRPPANFRAAVTADGVELNWECRPTETRSDPQYLYRIYRRSPDNGIDVALADVQCPTATYKDRTAEWEKTYEYRITTVTSVTLDPGSVPCPADRKQDGIVSFPDCIQVVSVEGDDSTPQKLFTKDIFPPATPTGLQAVFSGPGQAAFIDLLWAPNTEADLAGYNVYRREDSSPPVKINPEPVKTPAFRDSNVALGKTYWYSVSAVDQRGNESPRSQESSESVPAKP